MPRPEQIRTDVTELLAHARAGLRIDNEEETKLPEHPIIAGLLRRYQKELMFLFMDTGDGRDNEGFIFRLSGESECHDESKKMNPFLRDKLKALREQIGPMRFYLVQQLQNVGADGEQTPFLDGETHYPAAALAKQPDGRSPQSTRVQLESAMLLGRPGTTHNDFQATSGSFTFKATEPQILAPVDYALGVELQPNIATVPSYLPGDFNGMPLVTGLKRAAGCESLFRQRIFTLTDEIYNRNAAIVRAAVRTLLNG